MKFETLSRATTLRLIEVLQGLIKEKGYYIAATDPLGDKTDQELRDMLAGMSVFLEDLEYYELTGDLSA